MQKGQPAFMQLSILRTSLLSLQEKATWRNTNVTLCSWNALHICCYSRSYVVTEPALNVHLLVTNTLIWEQSQRTYPILIKRWHERAVAINVLLVPQTLSLSHVVFLRVNAVCFPNDKLTEELWRTSKARKLDFLFLTEGAFVLLVITTEFERSWICTGMTKTTDGMHNCPCSNKLKTSAFFNTDDSVTTCNGNCSLLRQI